MNNKIAADEVGDDLRKVANTLTEAATQTERTVEKKVCAGLPPSRERCNSALSLSNSKPDL